MHGLPDHEHGDSWLISRYWEDAFAGALGPLPEEVTSPCCSEFLVHRNRILARPREFYIHVRCCHRHSISAVSMPMST